MAPSTDNYTDTRRPRCAREHDRDAPSDSPGPDTAPAVYSRRAIPLARDDEPMETTETIAPCFASPRIALPVNVFSCFPRFETWYLKTREPIAHIYHNGI